MAWNGTRALKQRRYFDQHRRSVLFSTGRVHRRGVYLNRSLIVTALISLDAIVLRSFCSLHNINPGCRGKAAPGNLQNLIRLARVVLDQDFLPARQLVGVGLFHAGTPQATAAQAATTMKSFAGREFIVRRGS